MKISKISSTQILIGVIALLAVFIFFAEMPNKREAEQKAEMDVSVFQNFNEKDASKIEIKSGDAVVTLQRESKNALWKEGKEKTYPADSVFINETALQFIKDLKKEQIISRNPKKYSLFDVDGKKGREVVVYNEKGAKLADFFVGKQGESPSSYFLRSADKEEVILVKRDLSSIFGKPASAWRNLFIFNFDSKQAKKISIESQKGKSVFEKEKESWKAVLPARFSEDLDQVKIGSLISSFSSLKAQEVVEELGAEKFELTPEKAQVKIAVERSDGVLHTLLVGKLEKDAGIYYVKAAESEYIYKVGELLVNDLNKTPDDLKAEQAQAESTKK